MQSNARTEVRALFVSELKLYPFWRDSSEVHVCGIDGGLSIAFRSRLGIPIGSTHFDVNVTEEGVFYLLHIELEPCFRGRGIGNELYFLLEWLAKKLGCHRIEQTPSGTTFSGESRASYLERRGWKLKDWIAYKEI